MTQDKRGAIDTSETVFTRHGVDQQERVTRRCNLRRAAVEVVFTKRARTAVVREACGASHHWGRVLRFCGLRAPAVCLWRLEHGV